MRTSTRFRRDRAAVPAARAFVKHSLRSVGASHDTVERLELAMAEACNNVVLHAAGPTFCVEVAVTAGLATVVIADDGAGFVLRERVMPAAHATGCRGIPLMQALVERVDMSSDSAGTTVVLTQPLRAGAPDAAVVVER